MNFLLIQSAGEHPENAEFRECLCLARGLRALGHQAAPYGKGFRQIPSDHPWITEWADAIVTLEQYPDKADWLPDLASVKKPKLLWIIDEHCRGVNPYATEFGRGDYDVVLHSTLGDWTGLGGEHHWFPNAYDDTLIGPRDVGKKWDVGFIGNYKATKERDDWVRYKLREDVGLAFGPPELGENMVERVNQLKVHWNMNIADDINYRCFETIGCGVPLVTNSRGPVHDEQYKRLGFKNGVNCAIYRTYDECLMAIRALLGSDRVRDRMGTAGLQLAARHTYKERAKQLVEIVEGL